MESMKMAKRSLLLKAISNCFDIWGRSKIERPLTERWDSLAIGNDWAAVGDDLVQAHERFCNEGGHQLSLFERAEVEDGQRRRTTASYSSAHRGSPA